MYITQDNSKDESKKSREVVYNGYMLSVMLYILGEYASNEEIDNEILTVYSKCTNPENRKLRDETKIELLVAVMKFFFKFCNEKSNEETKEVRKELTIILEWFVLEMADNLDMYEMLNFYYGLIKEWETLDAESTIKIVNAEFLEELLPVHAQVHVKIILVTKFNEP